jgi:adenylate kinase
MTNIRSIFPATQLQPISTWLGSGSIDIFGAQFSGKDTQCERIANLLNGIYISSGDIFRKTGDQRTRQAIGKGGFAPTDVFMNLVLPYFSRPDFVNHPMMLSSIGRGPDEPAAVIEAAEKAGHPLKAVIHLLIDESTIYTRWEQMHEVGLRDHREDDTIDSLKQRLKLFKEVTMKNIEFFHQQGPVIEINGNQSIEAVEFDILQGLYKLATAD